MRLVGIARLAAAAGTTARRSARRGPRRGSPARSRTVECRPSAPTVRSARTSSGPSGVSARTPATRPPSSIRVGRLRLACAGGSAGSAARCSARKSRKSHCGMKAMNLQCVGRWLKSATVSRSPIERRMAVDLLVRQLAGTRRAGRARASPRASRDGWCRRGSRAGSRRASRARRRRRRRARAGSRASCRPGRRRRCSSASRSFCRHSCALRDRAPARRAYMPIMRSVTM